MERIKLHDKYFVPYIRYEEISKAIDVVAEKINKDFRGREKPPILLCVLNGSIMFTGELMKRITFPCEITSIRLASYEGTLSSGKTKTILGLTADIKGRDLIIVEDIVDTGTTIYDIHKTLTIAGANDIKICTLLLKPEVYNKSLRLDYVAMEVDNRFLVGFGLDYNQLGRNSKDIYILDKSS
ncbi:MAG TPA: hypoxanthine phosphoribosyltransferase, partial [Bacteroidales bacterium]|nr:hypoxanthine phosphoribosyltransferase [Bacteroidales bacterium]HPK29755.1 hypoxanthine phosphoribosyltransferase [Bacteroidales bacterium]